jgi:uncharacterized membrane protein YcaP (DUF421 family)
MHIDWNGLLLPKTSLLELVLRGSVMYLSLFFMLRIIRREAGSLSVSDILVVVLIADAAQNGMAGDSKSLPEALILCGTIVAWSCLIDRLAFRFPAIRSWLAPPSLVLIRNGRFLFANLRKESISKDELMSQLRLQGIDDVSKVKAARLEPEGKISVIQHESQEQHPPQDAIPGAG